MKEKQRLDRRDTYTDATQARDPYRNIVLMPLNRERILSVLGLKNSSNNPGVNLQSGMTGRDLMVSVLNMLN